MRVLEVENSLLEPMHADLTLENVAMKGSATCATRTTTAGCTPAATASTCRLLMALWRRQPKHAVTMHSDQGCQFTGHEWQTFLREHNLVSSMSRRGNCHDNAVAESFFQLLKREHPAAGLRHAQ